MFSVENTWKELFDANVDTAVVSFGAIEQHGYHLPLGVDWILADNYATAIAEKLNAYVLPAMPYGCSREHMGFPGTVTLRPFTLAAVLEDIVESLVQNGIHNIIVLNTHGGNWILKPILRELNYKHPDAVIIWAKGSHPDDGDTIPVDIHAGSSETSRMMAVRPDLVRDNFGDNDNPGSVGQEFNDYIGFDKTTRNGVWGKPSEASISIGREISERELQDRIRYIQWALAHARKLKNMDSIVGGVTS